MTASETKGLPPKDYELWVTIGAVEYLINSAIADLESPADQKRKIASALESLHRARNKIASLA